MQVYHLHFPFQNLPKTPSATAIGYFDGVHLGHQTVIQKTVHIANEHELKPALMTFHPHPKEILKNEVLSYITPLQDKIDLVAHLGIEVVYVVHFTSEVAQMTPNEFINQVLLPLGIQQVIVGFDFRFGRGGSGDAHTLSRESHGALTVHIIDPITREDKKISSSIIREKLLRGEVEKVHECLSRPYTMRGTVVNGEKIGRTIGFPTANIALKDRYFIPKMGVYGVRISIGKEKYFGVMNIGVKPTVSQHNAVSIEVHILDFSHEIYDEEVAIEMLFFIRDERKFSSIEELTKQIQDDIVFAKGKFVCYTV